MQYEYENKSKEDLIKELQIKNKEVDELRKRIDKLEPKKYDDDKAIQQKADHQDPEEILRESEEQFRSLISNMPSAVYRCKCDAHWTMLFLSEQIKEITGYPPEEFIENKVRSYESVIHEADTEHVDDTVSARVSKKEPFHIEYRIIHKDGGIRWIQEHGQAVFENQDDDEPLWLYGIIHDNTHKHLEKVFREKEEQFQSLVSNVPGAVYRCKCDAGWTMLFLSEQIKEITGYPPEEFIENKARSYASVIHEDDTKKVDDTVSAGVNKREPFHIDYRIIHKDGSVRWVQEHGQAIFGNQPEPLWLDGIIHDNTTRKELVERRKALVEFSTDLGSQIIKGESRILEFIHKQAEQFMDTDNMYIALYDKDSDIVRFGLIFKNGERINVEPRKAGKGRTEEIIRTGESILIATREESEEWYKKPGCKEYIRDALASWIGVPMMQNEKVIGVVATYHPTKDHIYSKDDLEFLQAMANLAAIALDNARLYKNLEKLVKERTESLENLNHQQRVLINLGQKLISSIQLKEDDILKLIHQNASELMDADNMYIGLHDKADDSVHFPLAFKNGDSTIIPSRTYGTGRTEEIIRTHEPIFIATKKESEEWYNEKPERTEYMSDSMASYIGVPMMVGEKVLGVISTYHPTEDFVYNKDDLEILQAMANIAAIALDNASLYSKEEQYAKELEEKVDLATSKIAEAQDVLTRSVIAADIVHRLNNLGGTIPVWANTIKAKAEMMINEIMGNIKELIHISEEAINHKKISEDESDFIYRLHNIISTIPIRVNQLKAVIDDKTNKIQDDVEMLRSEVENLNEPHRKVKTNIIPILKTISDQLRIQYYDRIEKGDLEINNSGISPNLHMVAAFPKTLPNAVFNIVSNSIESITEKSSGILTVKAENYKDDNDSVWVRIEISDTGKGIPKGIFNKLFTPFVSTKGERRGYGLWRTKNVIENIEGRIWFDNEKEEGAKCVILLPAIQED